MMIPDRGAICASHLFDSGDVKGLTLCEPGSLPTPCQGVFFQELPARCANVPLGESWLLPPLKARAAAIAVICELETRAEQLQAPLQQYFNVSNASRSARIRAAVKRECQPRAGSMGVWVRTWESVGAHDCPPTSSLRPRGKPRASGANSAGTLPLLRASRRDPRL